MRHLFENWRQVRQRLRSAETVALFLDFDGTLAPVRSRPEHAALDGATRRALRQLVHCPRVHVCVISGRRFEDVSSRLRVPGLAVMGLHGWDRESRDRGPAARALSTRSGMLIDKAR
ncbi:MAG TPA: trehalose-phosphatase, partial [Bryobacteraceae bacterium]|nr:trehalose-phosphatase [Bryobacteraceae bacterium]